LGGIPVPVGCDADLVSSEPLVVPGRHFRGGGQSSRRDAKATQVNPQPVGGLSPVEGPAKDRDIALVTADHNRNGRKDRWTHNFHKQRLAF
jgi:hypothetical protein